MNKKSGFVSIIGLLVGLIVVAAASAFFTIKEIDQNNQTQTFGTTILQTNLSDTLGTFRTNVNTSLTNLKTDLEANIAHPNIASSTGSLSVLASTTGQIPVNKGGTGTSTTPSDGQLLIGSGGTYKIANLTAATGTTITNSSGTISIGSNITGLSVFGTGSDGDVTISATATNTRDMFYHNLTVNAQLNTGGYRIFVSGTLTGNGSGTIISPQANNGVNSSNTTGAVGGASSTIGWFTNQAGTKGRTGNNFDLCNGNSPSGGSGPVSGANVSHSIGTSGGQGGVNGGTVGTISTVSTTTSLGVSAFDTIRMVESIVSSGTASNAQNFFFWQTGGGGTGGEGNNGHVNNGGGASLQGGGGGGASAYPIFIAASTWAGTFTITGRPGIGGNGLQGDACGITNGGSSGGGGGGAGPSLVAIYATKTYSGTINLAGGNPGTNGTGATPAAATGTTGTQYLIPISAFTLP